MIFLEVNKHKSGSNKEGFSYVEHVSTCFQLTKVNRNPQKRKFSEEKKLSGRHMEQEVLEGMSRSQSFLTKSTTPYVVRETFPVGPAIGLDNLSPATEEKCFNSDLNITHIHVTKHETILRQVSKLARAPPDVRKKQKQSHTDVREETSLLHKQPSGAPNAATSTGANYILYINRANCCRNAYTDVFMPSVITFRVSTWMHLSA